LPIKCDLRDANSIKAAIELTVKNFGAIDILINNASAISLTPVSDTPLKTFDLMHSINVRGTYIASSLCLPYLKKS